LVSAWLQISTENTKAIPGRVHDSRDLLEPIEELATEASGDVERANEAAPEREPTNSE
jgi:hypothetical protein